MEENSEYTKQNKEEQKQNFAKRVFYNKTQIFGRTVPTFLIVLLAIAALGVATGIFGQSIATIVISGSGGQASSVSVAPATISPSGAAGSTTEYDITLTNTGNNPAGVSLTSVVTYPVNSENTNTVTVSYYHEGVPLTDNKITVGNGASEVVTAKITFASIVDTGDYVITTTAQPA